MMGDILDMEANFRPSPTDPNWLSQQPATTMALPYGMPGRSQGTYSTQYGAPGMYPVDLEANFRPNPADPNWLAQQPYTTQAVTYGMQGRQQQTFADAYGVIGPRPFLGMRPGVATRISGMKWYQKRHPGPATKSAPFSKFGAGEMDPAVLGTAVVGFIAGFVFMLIDPLKLVDKAKGMMNHKEG